jgi:hypothetical protein
MMYVEFIERDRFMPIEIFRHLGDQKTSWAGADRMVLQLGRTLRLGPVPSYLAFWRIDGIARLDAWEDYFRSDAWPHNARSQALHRAVHIQRGGLYDDLVLETDMAENRLYYVEYFEAPGDTPADGLVAAFVSRGRENARLHFLLRRIGLLGPDPAHLAVWTLPDYLALEAFARAPAQPGPARILTVGVYRDFGREVL